MSKIKFKTSKSVAKRIHVTANGLVKVKKIGRNHHALKKRKLTFSEKKRYVSKALSSYLKKNVIIRNM